MEIVRVKKVDMIQNEIYTHKFAELSNGYSPDDLVRKWKSSYR